MKQIILDIGGTGMKGQLAVNGVLTGMIKEYPSRADADRNTLIDHLCSVCMDLLQQPNHPPKPCAEVAMAFPGPFDYEHGIPLLRGLGKYESLYGVHLPSAMQQRWKELGILSFEQTEWSFLNDVSAFALGAVHQHSMLGRVMCVCLGTGVGSAFCVHGSLCTDEEEHIPDRGWIYPLPFRNGMIDDVLSARGIRRLAEQSMEEAYTPLQLAEMARGGNRSAMEVWKQYGEMLAECLEKIACNFGGDTIILGGKIALSAALFVDPLHNACQQHTIKLLIEPDTSILTHKGLLIASSLRRKGDHGTQSQQRSTVTLCPSCQRIGRED